MLLASSALSVGDILGVFGVVIGLLLSAIGTLIWAQLKGIRENVDDNSRHLASLAASWWALTVRVGSVEDHLAEKDGYRPPRVIGDAESRRWETP